MRLSELGESNLIKRLRTKCTSISSEIIRGIGDDAAVVKIPSGKLLISSDMMVEDVHFNLAYTTFYQLGYKILAVNISDIFAMGGRPKFFLLDICVPGNYKLKHINELYSGILKIARKFGIVVIGGDTSASKHGLMLTGTIIGVADKVITRSGAREGDGIFVTNTLGDSAMGLMLLKKLRTKNLKLRSKKSHTINSQFSVPISHLKLIRRHLMPGPAPLTNTKDVTSMIDISDGLLIDISRICDESKMGAVIYKDKIPVSKELTDTAKKLGEDPLTFALKGGEDYLLLFTSSDIKRNAFMIGEIVKKGRFLVDSKGRRTPFKPEGYEHFR